MRKRLLQLFSAFCLVGLTAQAEVIQSYEYNFDDEINTADKYFHPQGWLHSMTMSGGSTSNFAAGTYEWSSDGGMDGSGCLGGNQKSSSYYDILYSPEVTGKASIYVKQKDASGTIEFYTIKQKNGTYAYSFETLNVDVPKLSTDEWVKIEIPAQEGKRIGLRLDKVYVDNFSADEVNFELEKSFTLSNARVTDKNAYADADGVYHIKYTIDVTNTGEGPLNVGDEGYAINHCYDPSEGYSYGISYDDYLFFGSTPLPESLEVGETKTMTINANISINTTSSRQKIYVVDDMNKDIKKQVDLGYFTLMAYQPKLGLMVTGTDEEYMTPSWNAYTATLTMGVVTQESQKKKTITLKNTAPVAPVTIEGITIEGTDFTSDFTGPKTLQPGESVDVVLSLVNNNPGVFVNKMSINAKGMDAIKADVTAAVPAEGVANIGFEESKLPVGFVETGTWEFTAMPEEYATEGHKVAISSTAGAATLTTSKMSVKEGELLLLSGYIEGRRYDLKVEYSADRVEWTNAFDSSDETIGYAYLPSEDTGVEGKYQRSFVAVENIPAGEWYVKITASDIHIDDIYGFTLLPVEPELILGSSDLPTAAVVNNPYVAKVEVSNAGDKLAADDYSVTLFVDDKEFAKAETEDIAAGETVIFEMTGMMYEAGKHQVYAEVAYGEKKVTTDVAVLTVKEEATEGKSYMVGPDSGAGNGPVGASASKSYLVRETLYSKDKIDSYIEGGIAPNSKIESISYYGKYTGSTPIEAEFKVYIKNTDETSFNGKTAFSDVEEMQKAYDGTVTISKQDGGVLFTVKFDEPFVYTGAGIDILTQSFIPNPPMDYPTLNYYNKYESKGALEYKTSSNLENLPASGSTDNYVITVGLTTVVDIAVVTGKVTHAVTGEPLADVNVSVESPEKVIYKTTTDENGEYTLNVLQPDKQYKVKATKENHDDYESEDFLDLSSLSATHHFTMKGTSTGIESVAAQGVSINVVEGGLAIYAETETDVNVYDLLGRAAAQLRGFKGEKKISLSAGIYVVNGKKVAVK